MKALKIIVTGMVFFLVSALQAQVSVNVNFGVPPPWGPVGYTSVRYYYLPDVEAYYDIQAARFIYYGGGTWVHRTYLPALYKNYDLYGGYKVVMRDYHGNAPYTYFKEHKKKYGKGYHGEAQRTLGERPGKRNSGTKNSPDGNHDKKGNGGGKDKGGSHGNSKNMKEDHNHGHGDGNGKKK